MLKVTLCTSPHLNRAPFFDGRYPEHEAQDLPFAQTFVPTGLLSIAAAAAQECEAVVLDINKAINSGTLPLSGGLYGKAAEWISEFDPDVLGFMTDCDSFHHVIRICSAAKARRPNLRIVLGCVHASYSAAEILGRYDFIEYVIRGEGEVAFPQLLAALQGNRPLTSVGNLTFRQGDRIVRTPDLPLIADLDDLPWIYTPALDLSPEDAVWVEVGRGCPFKCNFCVTAPYWQRKHRIKSPQRIISELRMLRDCYSRETFNLTHDLFTTDRKWVLSFCDALTTAELDVTWTCSSRTDTLDEEQLEAMARAGCRDIYFGVETGGPAMQGAIDKSLNLKRARDIIGLCHGYGVSTTIGFIAGLPDETEGSLRSTLAEATHYLQQGGSTVHLFGFGPYRGSRNFEAIAERLTPEPEFVDFPLGSELQNENRALIRAHRDVFARYSRLHDAQDRRFRRLLEVAEEFFPILNAVPLVYAKLLNAEPDPLEVLKQWSAWLESHQKDLIHGHHGHLGSIGQFLDFAGQLMEESSVSNTVFEELLRWERHKQRFRSLSSETALPPGWANDSEFALNPTALVDSFAYAPTFENLSNKTPSTFVFYRRPSGDASIARLEDNAVRILKSLTAAQPTLAITPTESTATAVRQLVEHQILSGSLT